MNKKTKKWLFLTAFAALVIGSGAFMGSKLNSNYKAYKNECKSYENEIDSWTTTIAADTTEADIRPSIPVRLDPSPFVDYYISKKENDEQKKSECIQRLEDIKNNKLKIIFLGKDYYYIHSY